MIWSSHDWVLAQRKSETEIWNGDVTLNQVGLSEMKPGLSEGNSVLPPNANQQ